MYSLDSGQAAFWDFDTTEAPPSRPMLEVCKVPSEQHLSLCSLSWQLFMEVGRDRFLFPEVT